MLGFRSEMGGWSRGCNVLMLYAGHVSGDGERIGDVRGCVLVFAGFCYDVVGGERTKEKIWGRNVRWWMQWAALTLENNDDGKCTNQKNSRY